MISTTSVVDVEYPKMCGDLGCPEAYRNRIYRYNQEQSYNFNVAFLYRVELRETYPTKCYIDIMFSQMSQGMFPEIVSPNSVSFWGISKPPRQRPRT